ncbi:MAG: amidohydrolase family protein [Acidobacteriota bacterium]|nr:amidohydrolase family protein [Acidobacteriota bacterium]
MNLRKFSLTLACVLALAVSFLIRPNQARSFQSEAYAIKDATIVTVTGATIQKGTVVIRNGLIAAVGADVAVPADARVIDANGLTVYPGLFDAHTSYGVRQAETPAGAGGGRGATQIADPAQAFLARMSAPPSTEGLLPEVTVVDQLQVAAETFDQQRAAGITTALTAPRSGVFQGQSALINLGDVAGEKLILKAPVSLNIGFSGGRGGGGGGGYPGSLMGIFAFLRQSLLDAQQYREEWARYNKSPRGATRPQVSKSSAALQPVINGEMPVVFNVSTVREIQRAIGLAEEFNLKYLLSGASQSYEIADYLKSKKATVLLSLSFPQKPAGLEDPESESLRTLRDRTDAPKAAAALHKAGVRFAFTSGTLTRPADYLANAARAIEAGLPKDEALKAMTIYPAQIFGVSEQLGSIEKGKIANLIVASGDIFAKDTKVKHIFVDGKYFVAKAPEQMQRPGGTFAGGGRRGGPGGGAPPNDAPPAAGEAAGMAAGTWTLSVNSPRGEMKMTINLQQNGDAVTGELSLPFGAAPITRGTIKGNDIELEYTITPPNGQPTTGTLKGRIEGGSISGQMGMMGRNSDFTGAKTPKE